MATVDSSAVFKARALQVGIAAGDIVFLKNARLDTFAQYAFCSTYQPGGSDDGPLRTVLEASTGRVLTAGEMSAYRRLFYEAFTLAATDLKSKLDRGDDSITKRLPTAERHQRFLALQDRLKGVVLAGEKEPSDHLVDAFNEMFESNRIKWLPWSKLTKKDDELCGKKTQEVIKKDTSGHLKVSEVSSDEEADQGSDLLIQLSLFRRSVAMDLAFLFKFEKMEEWSEELLRHRLAKPLKGFKQITMEQLEGADKSLFMVMARLCRAGIQPLADGTKPLEVAYATAHLSTEVTFHLLPTRAGAGDQGDGEPRGKKRKVWDAATKKWVKVAKKDDKPTKVNANAKPNGGGGKGGKGSKGGGKGGKGGKTDSAMPAALRGGVSKKPDGAALCYGFNLHTCTTVGPSCPKGLHECCMPGCFQAHAFLDHP
jgi:hypothetical protein